MTIEILESVEDEREMIYMLEYIIKLIDRGCTSGYYPHWQIHKEDPQ